MLTLFIWLLTIVMVLDCSLLVLLVLVQLPKKEAGMGQAFGGAATDALFGAGSGNALTKMTKWAAGIFFGLAVLLTVLSNYRTSSSGQSNLGRLIQQAPTAPPPPTAATNTGTPAPALKINVPTNIPAATPPPTTAPASTSAAPATGTPAPAATK